MTSMGERYVLGVCLSGPECRLSAQSRCWSFVYVLQGEMTAGVVECGIPPPEASEASSEADHLDLLSFATRIWSAITTGCGWCARCTRTGSRRRLPQTVSRRKLCRRLSALGSFLGELGLVDEVAAPWAKPCYVLSVIGSYSEMCVY